MWRHTSVWVSESRYVSVSSADRVWVWPLNRGASHRRGVCFSILGGSSVGVANEMRHLQTRRNRFQYPRRIECGCGRRHLDMMNETHKVSVSSADRVWVWLITGEGVSYRRGEFQYPRRIECGCGAGAGLSPVPGVWVSVSSADRVWVWRGNLAAALSQFIGFSILGGSSVGVAVGGAQSGCRAGSFQYPRRIECGCGRNKRLVVFNVERFQYPRRIECGCGKYIPKAMTSE